MPITSPCDRKSLVFRITDADSGSFPALRNSGRTAAIPSILILPDTAAGYHSLRICFCNGTVSAMLVNRCRRSRKDLGGTRQSRQKIDHLFPKLCSFCMKRCITISWRLTCRPNYHKNASRSLPIFCERSGAISAPGGEMGHGERQQRP